jgi:hypothetical protein
MSKRYGRNQKRKARERIAALQQLSVQAMREVAGLTTNLRSARAEIDRAKRLAIPFCALFEPTVTQGYGDPSDGQPHYMRELPQFKLSDLGAEVIGPDTTVRDIPLDLVYTYLDEDRLRNMRHARVTYGSGEVCYSLSRETMANMPREYLVDLLTREISGQLARLLVNKFRGALSPRSKSAFRSPAANW